MDTYLTQGFRSIDDPSIEFPLRQVSKKVENALCTPSIGTYCGGVSARSKLGRQQGLQPDPINVPIMYDLLSRHDTETLVYAGSPGLDEVCVLYQ